MPEHAFSLFDEYVAAYARGERPSAEEYLARAGKESDELAALIERFLQAAPTPSPTDTDVELFEGWLAGESPLMRLRVTRGLTRDRMVEALIGKLGLDPAKRDKLKRYYHELESGLLDEQRVDKSVFTALAEELGSRVGDLIAWRPRPLFLQSAYLRADEVVMADMRMDTVPEPEEEPDEIDRLFHSEG
jgi:hypothetical protein